MYNIEYILTGFLLGFVPTFVWLWFWLREDRLHPEPRRLIALSFIAGGLAVLLVMPLQLLVQQHLSPNTADPTPQVLVYWAVIEEVMKFLLVLIAILWRKAVDEPIDMLIYMITGALGFAAVENMLFIISTAQMSTLAGTVVSANFRFFGATLLHTLASSAVGMTLALAFYKPYYSKVIHTIGGIWLASALHIAFNLFILNSSSGGILKVFAFVWLGVVALLLFFEKVKQMPLLTRNVLSPITN